MPYEDADEVPEESDFRFVVLGHPELGEFLDWAVAVAKAWEVTLPGQKRVEVALVQRGLTQLRIEDEDEDEAEADVSRYGATVFDVTDSRAVVHIVERAHLSWVQMHCGRVSTRKHLIAVPDPKGNGCGVCFNPDYDSPPRPAHW